MKTGIYWQDPKYALRPGRDFIFDPSLVLYLPLGKLDGASFMSKEARGYLCTATGALWKPNGRLFDGVDDLITVPADSSLYSSDYVTFEMWIKPTDAGEGGFGRLWWKWSGIAGSNAYMNNGTRIQFSLGIDGTSKNVTTAVDSVPFGSWSHIVMVYDGANLLGYVNAGTPVSTPATGSIDDHSGDDLALGARAYGANYFYGLIGEARIYNRALTPLEIQRNYLATKWRYR